MTLLIQFGTLFFLICLITSLFNLARSRVCKKDSSWITLWILFGTLSLVGLQVGIAYEGLLVSQQASVGLSLSSVDVLKDNGDFKTVINQNGLEPSRFVRFSLSLKNFGNIPALVETIKIRIVSTNRAIDLTKPKNWENVPVFPNQAMDLDMDRIIAVKEFDEIGFTQNPLYVDIELSFKNLSGAAHSKRIYWLKYKFVNPNISLVGGGVKNPWRFEWPQINGVSLSWEAVTAISSLLLTVITFIMVLDYRETRKASLKPELIILDPVYRYEFRWVPKEDLSPIIRPELKLGEINKYETRLPVFEMKNIGAGVALNIKLQWEVIGARELNEIAKDQLLKDFDPHYENNMFCLQSQNKSEARKNCFSAVLHEVSSMPYVSISSTNRDSQPLFMPASISGAYDAHLIVAARPNGSIVNFINGPLVKLEIQYEDTDHHTYKKAFMIKSQLLYLPDAVSSDSNSVKQEYFSAINIRGTLRFHVEPMA